MIIRDLYPLSPPENWQTFEDICFHLWRKIWRDDNAQKNGRQGQPQAGVDIFGQNKQKQLCGVQCKGTATSFPGRMLTAATVKAEVKKAKRFKPKLQHYTIASIMPRDTHTQQAAREITKSNKGKAREFDVSVWSWEEIRDHLYDYPDIIRKFYPAYFSASATDRLIRVRDGLFQIDLYGIDSIPVLSNAVDGARQILPVNDQVFRILHAMLIELAANAFDHGSASQALIEISGAILLYKDDGKKFNSLNPSPNITKNAGLRYLQHAITLLQDKVEVDVPSTDAGNIIRFSFHGDALRHHKSDIYTFELSDHAFSREEIRQVLQIPSDAKQVTVNLSHEIGIAASTAHEVAIQILEQTDADQRTKIVARSHIALFLKEFDLPERIIIEDSGP